MPSSLLLWQGPQTKKQTNKQTEKQDTRLEEALSAGRGEAFLLP